VEYTAHEEEEWTREMDRGDLVIARLLLGAPACSGKTLTVFNQYRAMARRAACAALA
jgi:hypothetical protein